MIFIRVNANKGTVCSCIAVKLVPKIIPLNFVIIEFRSRLEIALVSILVSRLTMTKDKCYSNIVYSIRRHTETIQ